MATLLEERHRNRIKIALFVRCLIIDESGDFISYGKRKEVSFDGTEGDREEWS